MDGSQCVPPGAAVATGTTPTSLALAVADANWFTTEHLFRELDRDGVDTLFLSCMDVQNAVRKRIPPWAWRPRLAPLGPHQWRRELVLPSGWMKRFPTLGMRPIARAVRRWRREHAPDSPLALAMTYPYYLHLRDQLRPDRTVYYNIDDYTLFWPARADEVRALELKAVRESDLTVCVARVRAEALRREVPEAADRIRHLPHGAPTPALAPHPWDRPAPPPPDLAGLPRPLLGFVGSMEDRVDWALLDRLAAAFPGGSLVLIGRPPALSSAAPWAVAARRCIDRPNVHALGWRPQSALPAYNQAFDVVLIPYRADHPFNRVCCPTKIMDGMASSRPVVTTAIPECQDYAGLFHVAADADAFLDAVTRVVAAGSDDGRAGLRLEHARAHTCRAAADRLAGWILA